MRTHYLLTATAASALLCAAPAFAQLAPATGAIHTNYTNNSVSNFSTDVSFDKDVSLTGNVELEGEVNASSAATASNNARQQMNRLDPEAGGPETVSGTSITGSGNIGVNVSAGFWNDQLNSAALSISNNVGTAEASTPDDPSGTGGWADATTSSLQTLNNIAESAEVGDDENSGANSLAGAAVSGAGNIGVNEAAGMFNEQANLMTLAIATNSVLAEAQAEVVQLSSDSSIGDNRNANVVAPGAISGSGNIGVNLTAGFGNQQANALTIATHP